MAVTKIWPIKGNISRSISYISNPDKTDQVVFQEAQESLKDVLLYVTNKEKTKTGSQYLVTGINCFPETAKEEMKAVKEQYGKTGGVTGHHGYQSFAEGEVTPQLAHKIGVQLAEELWGDRFQVVVATHLDKANHLHNHFLINSVSFLDGRKFRDNIHSYKLMRSTSDRLCLEHDLSVIEQPDWGKAKHYSEWKAEQEDKPTWRRLIKEDVDEAIQNAYSMKEFYEMLKAKDYEWKVGKDIAVRPAGKERFFRLGRNFGEMYMPDGIREQILSHGLRFRPPMVKEKVKEMYPKENPFGLKPQGGLQGLYLHYCYVFGIFKEKPDIRKVHFLLREEIIKMDAYAREAQFIGNHDINTLCELVKCESQKKSEMQELTRQRQRIQYQKRKNSSESDKENYQKQIDKINQKLKECRKDVKICESIKVRSVSMATTLQKIEQESVTLHESDRHTADVQEYKKHDGRRKV